ncbi:hypothetical protein FRC10_003129 [Ceratobasidium sp. 414]|nr:hypothetical protein FRC10_003129 [Ceratobasidium sp. 414]
MSDLQKPAYPAPQVPPSEWTLEDLHKHLETAVLLELHTIPLYLFPMYCVKPEGLTSATMILGVVKQEMLHLGLAGNLLCATRGQPKLYGPKYTPEYPCEIFYEPITLHLRPPNKDAIASFVRSHTSMELESPFAIPGHQRTNVLPDYHSIGQFYEAVVAGFRSLHKKLGDALFDLSTLSRQFSPDDDSYPDGGMIQIKDLDSAIKAMTLIIEQGEGTTGTVQLSTPSHWQIFKKLEDMVIPYYLAVEDPKTSEFEGNIKKAMLACDAAYSYLLLSIEKSWTKNEHRVDLLSNISDLMTLVIKRIAGFLVTQQLEGSDEFAGPPFNRFDFSSTALAYKEMIAAIKEAKDAYPQANALRQASNAAGRLFDLAELDA